MYFLAYFRIINVDENGQIKKLRTRTFKTDNKNWKRQGLRSIQTYVFGRKTTYHINYMYHANNSFKQHSAKYISNLSYNMDRNINKDLSAVQTYVTNDFLINTPGDTLYINGVLCKMLLRVAVYCYFFF